VIQLSMRRWEKGPAKTRFTENSSNTRKIAALRKSDGRSREWFERGSIAALAADWDADRILSVHGHGGQRAFAAMGARCAATAGEDPQSLCGLLSEQAP